MVVTNTLLEAPGPKAMDCAEEDRVIEQAMQILDRRLFTRGASLQCASTISHYLKLKLAPMDTEVFAVVFLDSLNRVLKFEVLFHGLLGAVVIHPRQVIKRALEHNAAAIIAAHNHPSGCSLPSSEDRRQTQRLKQALELVDVRMLDHVIVGAGRPLSMVEHGLF